MAKQIITNTTIANFCELKDEQSIKNSISISIPWSCDDIEIYNSLQGLTREIFMEDKIYLALQNAYHDKLKQD